MSCVVHRKPHAGILKRKAGHNSNYILRFTHHMLLVLPEDYASFRTQQPTDVLPVTTQTKCTELQLRLQQWFVDDQITASGSR